MIEDYLTTVEIAPLIGITRAGINAHIKAGNLKAVMLGGTWIVKASDVAQFINARSRGEFLRGHRSKTK
jgi:excisionase family DNA binding protein